MKMFQKKNWLLGLALVCGALNVAAQDDNSILAPDKKAMTLRIGNFEWVEPSKPAEDKMIGFLDIVKSKVSEAVESSGRFEVLDDEITQDVNAYMQSEAFMNLPPEQYREAITGIVNDNLLIGEVTKCKFTKRTTGANGYLCMLAIKLSVAKAYDKANIINSRMFVSRLKGKDLIVRPTTEAALDDALQSMTERLVDFFKNNFSVYGTLVSYDGKRAILSCGAPQGVTEGSEFQVSQMTVTTSGTQTEHVGKLKVKELLPDGTSLCTITENKDEIIQRFQNSSKNSWLQCRLILNQ